jgi:hypothetical protein
MLLGTNEKERRSIRERFLQYYNFRNKLVHASPKEIDIKENSILEIQEYYREVFKKLII